ncbi:periplasmic M16 family chaperone [Escherichia coli]|nr:periplasmic M16 family chaperone [Escherichia coli]
MARELAKVRDKGRPEEEFNAVVAQKKLEMKKLFAVQSAAENENTEGGGGGGGGEGGGGGGGGGRRGRGVETAGQGGLAGEGRPRCHWEQ